MIQTRAINDLATIVRGVSYKPVDASETSKDGYVPLLRAMNIDEGVLNLNDLIYVNPKRVSKLQRITKGDVVIAASTGSKKVIGKAAQSKNNWEGSFGAFCMVLRPNSQLIDVNYFGYFFQSVYYRKLISHMSSGANINNLKREYFDRLSIPIPSVSEQERIVTNLDQADSLRQKRKLAIALLDDYVKSVFLEMFGDPIDNPKKFEVHKLSQLYINEKEGTKCGPFGSALKKDEYVNHGIPVWTMDNIQGMDFVPEQRLFITESKYKALEKYQVMNDDIIISRAGTVGKMAIVNGQDLSSIISTNLIRLRLDKTKLLPLYFIRLMNYCKGRVGRLRTGKDGTFTHMNTGILDNLSFPVPPLDLQEKYAKVVQDTESLKHKMLNQSNALDNQFNALMQKHFNSN